MHGGTAKSKMSYGIVGQNVKTVLKEVEKTNINAIGGYRIVASLLHRLGCKRECESNLGVQTFATQRIKYFQTSCNLLKNFEFLE